MIDKRFVASKRDIILFSIISVFASTFVIFPFSEADSYKYYIIQIIVVLSLFLPEIIAIIINKIIEHFNIQNIKALKITKILFNIFTFINFTFSGIAVLFVYTINHLFG